MLVVVPALGRTCEASRALNAEGVDFLLVEMEDEGHYGRLLADLWESGRGFTIVEHDVVPWPGALRRLADCERGWCGYEYPLGKRGKLGGALGCVRFSTRFRLFRIRLLAAWQTTPAQRKFPSSRCTSQFFDSASSRMLLSRPPRKA